MLDPVQKLALDDYADLYLTAGGIIAPRETSKARALVERGCKATYAELFGQSFVDALDSAETDDKHHSEALEWHWAARMGLIACELEINNLKKQLAVGAIGLPAFESRKEEIQKKFYPLFWAYFAIWSRGNMKTTIARYMIIVDAFLSHAHGVSSYALVVGGTVAKVRGTAKSIAALLRSEKIKEYAPEMAVVKKNDAGISQGWTAEFINTEANCVFHFIGLDVGVAGANVENMRPTFIVPDDIDTRKTSPVEAETGFNTFTREVIPTRQWNTLVYFAQNLISRFSTLYRIWKQQVKVLTNRYVTDPVPAVRDAKFETMTVGGIVKDVIVSGQVTWRGWNLREIQNQIDSMGLAAFRIECQHEVEQSREGLFHKKYDDAVHPISYSQFAAVYGSPDAWKDFYKVPFSDWARTKTKYHANVAGYLAVSSQNTKYPGFTFCVPLSFAADTQPEDVAERLLSVLTPFAYGNKRWRDLIDDAWKRANSAEHFETQTERLQYVLSYYADLIPHYSRKILEAYRVGTGANSHSEDKVRTMLNAGFGFSFVPSNPGKTDALEDIDAAMRVDYKLPHVFDDTKTGYTRWYVLCRDDYTKPPQIINGFAVYPPAPYPDEVAADDLHDEDLFRFQMLNRRFADSKLTELGEKIDEPLKLHDDFGQALQMVYLKNLLTNIELTYEEKIQEHLAPEMRDSSLKDAPDSFEKDAILSRKRLEIERLEKEFNQPVRHPAARRFGRR